MRHQGREKGAPPISTISRTTTTTNRLEARRQCPAIKRRLRVLAATAPRPSSMRKCQNSEHNGSDTKILRET